MTNTQTHTNQNISEHDKKAWLQLARTDHVGPITFHRLIDRFGSAQNALDNLSELSKKGGRKKPLVPASKDDVDREIDALNKMGATLLCSCDPDYPLSLSVLEDAPPVLTILGHAHLLSRPCLGVVGARNASLNGRKMAKKLALDIGQQSDCVIVSGLARGIDAAAHDGALDTGTIAVVGGGADVIYPRENTELYHSIIQRGAIVAENPLQWQPRAQDFPRRNRIISGLSLGVIVVEATIRSGSLITARLAGEQGRDVYAVPGFPADPRAAGPNSLIKDGAILVTQAQDVLENLHPAGLYKLEEKSVSPFHSHQSTPAGLSDDARHDVIDNLSFTPVTVDELVRVSQLNIACIQEILLELELAGRLIRHPGNRVSLVNNDRE